MALKLHDWIPSTLGHGEIMCRRCFITNREALAVGAPECDDGTGPNEGIIPASSLKYEIDDKTQVDLHNDNVGAIVRSIVKPALDTRMPFGNTMVLLESVVVGVMLVSEQTGFTTPQSRDGVLDLLVTRVKERIAKLAAEGKKLRVK